jgi:hypothetical protein
MPTAASLAVIVLILAGAIWASVLKTRRDERAASATGPAT